MNGISNQITTEDYLNYFQAVNEVNIFNEKGLNGTVINANEHLKPIRSTWKEFFHSLFEQLHVIFSSEARKLKQCNTNSKFNLLKKNITIINNVHEKFNLMNDSDKINYSVSQFNRLFTSSLDQFKKFNSLTQANCISKFVKKMFGSSIGNPEGLKINLPRTEPLLQDGTNVGLYPFFLGLRKEIWKGDYQIKKTHGYLTLFDINTGYLMHPRNNIDHNLSMLDHWVMLHTLKNQKIAASTFDFSTQNCYKQVTTDEELCSLLNYISTHRARIIEKDDSDFLSRYSVAIETLTKFLELNYEQHKEQFSTILEKIVDSVPASEKKIIKHTILYQFFNFFAEFRKSEEGKKLFQEFKEYDKTLINEKTVDERIIDEQFASFLKIVKETVKRCDS